MNNNCQEYRIFIKPVTITEVILTNFYLQINREGISCYNRCWLSQSTPCFNCEFGYTRHPKYKQPSTPAV